MRFLTLTTSITEFTDSFAAEFTDELWNPAKLVAIHFSDQKAFVGGIQNKHG